ncbi:MAG: T9SS type A sorting domain-containing protein [Chitinophagales bacterium]|nr:T9SS type A sorting domain-containing protein [Chitinophagales bacterium]
MRKRFVGTLILFLTIVVNAWCQKNDYVWLQGYRSEIGYDSIQQVWYGITFMDFNQQPVAKYYDSLGISLDQTNTSFSSDDGNLLFYSNCVDVYNSLHNIIENGDSINWGGVITQVNPGIAVYGYRHEQGMYAFASPSGHNQYFLVNIFPDTISGEIARYDKLKYHLIDMNANAGLGKVIQRDVNIDLNTFDNRLSSEMAAIRHGNGRDWWLILQYQTTNCYHVVLLDPTGFHVIPYDQNCGGSMQPYKNIGKFATTPDGNKVVYANTSTGITIFNFDRCSGSLTQPYTIAADSGFYVEGACISPNNRFLYISGGYSAYQYDLWATDIAASRQTIAVYDGHLSPFPSLFGNMQLAPDGRIYVDCGNGSNVYHVINTPDKPGDSCQFLQHSFPLISYTSGVPNFPNYRLGALPGSPCDTLGTSISQLTTHNPQLTIYPNPATEFVVIDYATAADWSKGELQLFIYDTKGAVIHEQPLPMYSGFQKIACAQWPSGVYQATIKRGETTIATGRVVKQ